MVRKVFVELANQFLDERGHLFVQLTPEELVDGLIAIWNCEGDEYDDGYNPTLNKWMEEQYGESNRFWALAISQGFADWIKDSLK